MDERRGAVERFFGAHAGGYAKSGSHAQGPDLAVLLDELAPKKEDLVLDVATGTGFTAAALAPLVKHVTGIDLTFEMLDEAKKLIASKGITNIDLRRGDA